MPSGAMSSLFAKIAASDTGFPSGLLDEPDRDGGIALLDRLVDELEFVVLDVCAGVGRRAQHRERGQRIHGSTFRDRHKIFSRFRGSAAPKAADGCGAQAKRSRQL